MICEIHIVSLEAATEMGTVSVGTPDGYSVEQASRRDVTARAAVYF